MAPLFLRDIQSHLSAPGWISSMTPLKLSEVHLHAGCCVELDAWNLLFAVTPSCPKRNCLPRMKAVKDKMQTTHKTWHMKSKEDGGNTVLLPVLSNIFQYRFNIAVTKNKYIREKRLERSEKTGKKTEGMIFHLSNALNISVGVWCKISALSDKIALKKWHVDAWDISPASKKTPPWGFGLARQFD